MLRPRSLLLHSVYVASALAQFVPAPTDLATAAGYANVTVRYKQVPTGICEMDPNVKSYAGYADVAPNEHIFWWFFETRNGDPCEAPLTVWINGGPGSSSMIGLFQENGPCGVDYEGGLHNNPFSWSNSSNMLYIDQPTTVGFSYSIPVSGYTDPSSGYIVTLPNATCPDYAQGFGTCGTYSYPNESLTANSTSAAAPNFWLTLQGFMGAFPEYSRENFNFATESYGGHYGPVFNEYILQQNAKCIPGAHNINLNAVLIGNGWYDPLIQYQAYYNFTVSPGNTYDYDPLNASVKAQWYNNLYGPGNCVDMTIDCYTSGTDEVCHAADNFCFSESENLYDLNLGRDEYDSAIGAYQNYSSYSSTTGNAFGETGDHDRKMMSVADVRKLLDQGVTVMMYAGDADYNCNWLGGEAVSKEVGAAGFSEAGYVNISTSDGIVHGQVKQSGPFSFVRIYESGHEVPFYQPLAALSIFERHINRLDIATGTRRASSGYRTVGTAESTYREGNSTIQFHVLSAKATYNTTLNAPNPKNSSTVQLDRRHRKKAKQGRKSKAA